MRLDHLLSKDEEVGSLHYCLAVKVQLRVPKGPPRSLLLGEEETSQSEAKAEFMKPEQERSGRRRFSGDDAFAGNTRSHPEHDG